MIEILFSHNGSLLFQSDVVLRVFPPSFGLDSLTVDGEFRSLAAFENDPEKRG